MWHLKLEIKLLLESVQFSHSVVFDSLRLHESQHVRPPCPSPTSGVHSNSCPSSHLILSHPLFLLPPIPPSVRVFLNESPLCMRWPKYCSSNGKESACNAGDQGSIPGLGSSSEKGNGNPLQYSCLENPMDRGAWQVTVHGVVKSQTWLSD